MILRMAATISMLLGATVLMLYLNLIGKAPFSSPAARHLRAMKDRVAVPARIEATHYETMAALPRKRPLGEYVRLERRAVSLEGYVQRMVRASDDDIHLELVPVPRMPGDGNLSYVTAEITPEWRRGSETWNYGALVAEFRPNFGGRTMWDQGTRRARVSGWLLYDYEYEDAPTYGRPRLTQWEIHPVTRIELWDDSTGAYREYAP